VDIKSLIEVRNRMVEAKVTRSLLCGYVPLQRRSMHDASNSGGYVDGVRSATKELEALSPPSSHESELKTCH
jgi:hypothetical protein